MVDDVDALIQRLNDLRVQEQDVLTRLVAARERERANEDDRNTPNRETRGARNFRVNDRVTITNRLAPSLRGSTDSNDREGVVTRVVGDKNSHPHQQRIHDVADSEESSTLVSFL